MFAQELYCNDPKLIQSYVLSALRPDGAAYYVKPRGNDGDNSEVHYWSYVLLTNTDSFIHMQPEGFFQTDLILSTARAFLPHATKSIMHPLISSENPPIGLYALILTAVCHLLAA